MNLKVTFNEQQGGHSLENQGEVGKNKKGLNSQGKVRKYEKKRGKSGKNKGI